jgi:hypothetical protein
MAEPYPAGSTADSRRRAQRRTWISGVLAVVLVGAAGAWWLAGKPGLPSLDLFVFKSDEEVVTASPSPSPDPSATAGERPSLKPTRLEEMEVQQGGIDQRVAAMEQRLARLDLQSQAAAGNAARAEGLLVTFAARRSLERGVPLGYLADQLRLRFGDAQPNAVRTVIEVSRNPVTLDRLIAELDGLAPELAAAPEKEGAWSWFSRELGELFVVRREDSPSPEPTRRLERARLFLQSGRTEAAIAEVRMLPNPAGANAWIAEATRYADAQHALELLETAALLEPRELRDGAGRSVEQLSPVAAE